MSSSHRAKDLPRSLAAHTFPDSIANYAPRQALFRAGSVHRLTTSSPVEWEVKVPLAEPKANGKTVAAPLPEKSTVFLYCFGENGFERAFPKTKARFFVEHSEKGPMVFVGNKNGDLNLLGNQNNRVDTFIEVDMGAALAYADFGNREIYYMRDFECRLRNGDNAEFLMTGEGVRSAPPNARFFISISSSWAFEWLVRFSFPNSVFEKIDRQEAAQMALGQASMPKDQALYSSCTSFMMDEPLKIERGYAANALNYFLMTRKNPSVNFAKSYVLEARSEGRILVESHC